MAAMPNWIDRLWANPHDREAEDALRQLWLRFQADRKEAWDRIHVLVAGSEKLKLAAKAQISKALPTADNYEVEPLAAEALSEAEKMLNDKRWELPAGTTGVFVPYLRAKNKDGHHHWIQRVLSRHFRSLARHGEREQRLEQGGVE